MPVQSVELLLDSASGERIRTDWLALAGGGLPALKPDNTPHLTLAAAQHIWPRIDRALGRLPFRPLRLRVGALAVFTAHDKSTAVLVRLVTPSAELLQLHQAVFDVLDGASGIAGHTRPGEWTPHITLARRFPLDRLGDATQLLHGVPELFAAGVSVRRWDGVNRRSWQVSDTPPPTKSDDGALAGKDSGQPSVEKHRRGSHTTQKDHTWPHKP